MFGFWKKKNGCFSLIKLCWDTQYYNSIIGASPHLKKKKSLPTTEWAFSDGMLGGIYHSYIYNNPLTWLKKKKRGCLGGSVG